MPCLGNSLCSLLRVGCALAGETVDNNVNKQVGLVLALTEVAAGAQLGKAIDRLVCNICGGKDCGNGSIPRVSCKRKLRVMNGSKTDRCGDITRALPTS